VSGIYESLGGERATGDNLVLRGDTWVWNREGNPPLVKNATIAQTVVVRYVPGGRGRLETVFPRDLCAPDCAAAAEYHPEKLITGPIAQRTLRRYNLKPDFASAPGLHD
jgi:hypothetical protein